MIRLGLIGREITQSRMAMLVRLAGDRTGQTLDYVLFDLAAAGARPFDPTFDACAADGLRGVNVTYPFKEAAAQRVRIEDPLVRAIGAVNTVIFPPDGAVDGGPRGFNTDYTGFLAAYRRRRARASPGAVAVIGSGGVGRAIAFALAALGADALRLYDVDADRSRALATALRSVTGIEIEVCDDCAAAVARAAGLVNATPVGMRHAPGCAVPADSIGGQEWVFDAIYTPLETELLRFARDRGIAALSGFDLFLAQAVDGFEIFTGVRLDDDDVAAMEGEILASLAAVP